MKQYDVAVVGAGMAGIAAALAAARLHKKTVLLEKQCTIGGLAVSGLISIYLPLDDGQGHQVSFGLNDELFWLAYESGVQRKNPDLWTRDHTPAERAKQRLELQYNPVHYSLELEKRLAEAGVDLYYDACISKVEIDGNTMTGVQAETVEGPVTFQADAFVDATGSAQLVYLAGLPVRRFEKGDTLAAWHYGVKDGKLFLNKMGTAEESDSMERESQPPLDACRYWADTLEEENIQLKASHDAVRRQIRKEKDKDKAYDGALLANMPQIRKIRAPKEEVKLKHQTEDSIGLVADWRCRGQVYAASIQSILTDMHNLYVAGRCAGCDDEAWEILRVIPGAVVTGEAAGTLAALEDKSLESLQRQLKKQGVRLK